MYFLKCELHVAFWVAFFLHVDQNLQLYHNSIAIVSQSRLPPFGLFKAKSVKNESKNVSLI